MPEAIENLGQAYRSLRIRDIEDATYEARVEPHGSSCSTLYFPVRLLSYSCICRLLQAAISREAMRSTRTASATSICCPHGLAWTAVGPVTVASDAFTGYTDMSVQNSDNSASAITPGLLLTGSKLNSSGQLNLNGLSATLNPQAQSSFGYFPVDSQRVLAIELDGQQTGPMMLEQVQQQ
jgi:hypothetical protein